MSCQIRFHLCQLLGPLCIPTGFFWSSTLWHYYCISGSDLSWLQPRRTLISGLLVLSQQKRQICSSFQSAFVQHVGSLTSLIFYDWQVDGNNVTHAKKKYIKKKTCEGFKTGSQQVDFWTLVKEEKSKSENVFWWKSKRYWGWK